MPIFLAPAVTYVSFYTHPIHLLEVKEHGINLYGNYLSHLLHYIMFVSIFSENDTEKFRKVDQVKM